MFWKKLSSFLNFWAIQKFNIYNFLRGAMLLIYIMIIVLYVDDSS